VQDPVKIATDELFQVMRSDTASIVANPGRLNREMVTRIGQAQERLILDAEKTIPEVARVERIPEVLVVNAQNKAIESTIRDSFPGTRNAILEISDIERHPVSNTYNFSVKFGKPDGSAWFRKQDAANYAKIHGIFQGNDTILKKGLGYYINYKGNLPENTNVVRDMMLKTDLSQSPDLWMPTFLNKFRTPANTLSAENMQNRIVATHAPAEITKLALERGESIRDLAAGRVQFDPVTGEELKNLVMSLIPRAPRSAMVIGFVSCRRLGIILIRTESQDTSLKLQLN